MWLFILKWWRELLIAALILGILVGTPIFIFRINALKAEKETLETQKKEVTENLNKCMTELGVSGKETSAVQEELVKCRAQSKECTGDAAVIINDCDRECAAYVKKIRDQYEKMLEDCYKNNGGQQDGEDCSNSKYNDIAPYLYDSVHPQVHM